MFGSVVIDDEPLLLLLLPFKMLVLELVLLLDEPSDKVDVCVIVTVLSKIGNKI